MDKSRVSDTKRYNPVTEDQIIYIVEPPDPDREKRKKYVEEMFKNEKSNKKRGRKKGND